MDRFESESILVLRYDGPKRPNADFTPVEVLQGPPFNQHISIKRDISMNPETGSLWIVFIMYAARKEGVYEPYPGSAGIEKFDRLNFEKVLYGLEQRNHVHYDKKKADELFDKIDSRESTLGSLDRDLSH